MTTTHDSPSDQSPEPTHRPVLWAFYLACSWTWCIGMFFPILLLRDMGWLGFVIFALPNVIGAAAMGFVLRSPEQSARMVKDHAPMLAAFSIITVAFHVYWMAWIGSFVRDWLPMSDTWLMGAAGAGVAWVIVSGRGVRLGLAPRLAAVLWVFSAAVLGAMIYDFVTGSGHFQPSTAEMIASPVRPEAAIWLAPVCVFGFALCPYLDPTFHKARQSVQGAGGGRLAFGLGFGVFFFAMIILTAIYAGSWLTLGQGNSPAAVAPWLGAGLLAHLLGQWVFTVRVHTHQLRSGMFPGWALPVVVVAALAAFGLGWLAPRLGVHGTLSGIPMDFGEVGYRVFMSAYGLLFPVYVWARIIPRTRRCSHAGWIAAVILAAPFYWLGVIEGRDAWLGIGVVIAVVVPLVVRESAAEPAENSARRVTHD